MLVILCQERSEVMTAMKTVIAVLISLGVVVDVNAATNTNATVKARAPIKIGKLVFEGGEGSSMEEAVVIKNAKTEEEGVEAEVKWVKKVHPKWAKGAQAVLNHTGKYYDRIEYSTPEGIKFIFFDITEFFGK
jgi:hypothetical protein